MNENNKSLNVLGSALKLCCSQPKTGFFRTGFCETGPLDNGKHTVCAEITQEFLDFTKSRGNDLSTPILAYGFPGLKPGDKWCLCASRWKEAYDQKIFMTVDLEATQISTLKIASLKELSTQ